MRINLPGLLIERQKSGARRYRVRVEGNKQLRILLHVTPDDPEFMEHYRAARAGFSSPAPQRLADTAIPHSLAWLTYRFEAAMHERVNASLMHAGTLKQRASFYARLREAHGDKHMVMPRAKVMEIRDGLAGTPGAADNMVKAIRAMYGWAVDMGHVQENPAVGVPAINRGTGAVPWSVDDLQAFRDRHPKGTMAYLALTLFMFTAARIGDVAQLGRQHERTIDRVRHLDWQPEKKGSARVCIPIMPPLAEAIAAQTVVGQTYLLNAWGRPFASKAVFGNWFRDRVREAGLDDRSAHGIRKAAGELMALAGATQYHIMAVHGHTQARTSESYTSGVNRTRLAREAMQAMAGIEW
ncbi:site-specific integrase [Psychromarinibacter sp. C21-152]|uniref:Site-specific integrase n=1 Tax=Psychromarinibacter sediminicola TaxID=3033385 RepID=A0AAE3TB03_9RHOB|nr:site-specific integrase [Psychromarinibacter sediminicola]MDF0603368.1 site-specific integrase [Psychromarinibacter sediminicola]